MPWNENNGGGGPWGSGGNDNNGNRGNNPWGNNGGPNRPRGGQEPPDLDEIVERFQASLGRMFGGSGGKRTGDGSGGGKGNSFVSVLVVFLILAAGVMFWPGRAIYSVGPDQNGVVLRFGEYVRTTAPGLHVKLPWPIETVELPEVTTTNTISIGSRDLGESQMLTRDENIVDIAFEVQWRVNLAYADGVRDYLFNVRNQEATVRAVAESAMREVVGTSDLVPIITTARAEVSQRTREVMQATLDEYDAGIQILQVNLQRAQAPQSVIDAFRDVDSAAQDAERARLNATAHANRVIPEARGEAAQITQQAQAYRDSVIAEAQGQADRFVAIYDEYVQAPQVTRRRMFLETMEEVLGRSELIILDDQGGAVPYLPLNELGRNRVAREVSNEPLITIFGAIVLIAAAIILSMSVYTVSEREQALVLRFGEPVGAVNANGEEAGLHFKAPFVDSVVMFDRRNLEFNMDPEEIQAANQERLVVDAFLRYRIVNPLRFYQTVRNERGVEARLGSIMDDSLRGVIGSIASQDVISGQRSALMDRVQAAVDAQVATQDLGIDVIDVRILRADLPQQIAERVFERMRSERQQEAARIRAEGEQIAREIEAAADRDATIIRAEARADGERLRGEGDARRNNIYALAYGRDAEFFSFYRSLDAYRVSVREGTPIIIPPDSEFFRYFRNQDGGE